MCGRITRNSPREAISKKLGVTRCAEIDWNPRYNVAPSQIVETIISVNGEKRLGPMHWGFVSPTSEEQKPRSRPDRSTGLAIILSLVVVASASAQARSERPRMARSASATGLRREAPASGRSGAIAAA